MFTFEIVIMKVSFSFLLSMMYRILKSFYKKSIDIVGKVWFLKNSVKGMCLHSNLINLRAFLSISIDFFSPQIDNCLKAKFIC